MISKKKQKGFSLVEVLCAITLLALVAAPIIQVIFSSLSVNAKSRKLLAATDLSSNIAEYISANTFEDYEIGAGASKVTVNGIRNAYFGVDDTGVETTGLTICDGGYYTYGNSSSALSGPKGDSASLSVITNQALKPTTDISNPPPTYSGKKLYITNVEYSGYTFDVAISILKNDAYSSNKYFTYDCFVDVLEPAVYDEDGNEIEASKSIIKTSTCIPNTLKTSLP